MFDTMTLTKAGAAVCAALLIYLFSGWAAESLYHVGDDAHAAAEGDHGEEAMDHGPSQGYVIASLEDTGGEEEEVVEVAFADVYAAADAAKGERVFSKCKACHKLDGSNGTGPHLDGVVDRAVAGVDGFGYSDPMIALGGNWTPEVLDAFLTKPKDLVPGTKMSFSGLKDIEDRANLIAYLATQ